MRVDHFHCDTMLEIVSIKCLLTVNCLNFNWTESVATVTWLHTVGSIGHMVEATVVQSHLLLF